MHSQINILHVYAKQNGHRPAHVSVPKRFVYFWEVSSFLDSQKYTWVKSVDCVDNKHSLFELGKFILENNIRIVILLVRISNLSSSKKLLDFFKSIKKDLNIIIYGDVVNLIPSFFKNNWYCDLVIEGDWELSLKYYIDFIRKNRSGLPYGVYLYKEKRVFKGKLLATNWHFSDITKYPYKLYNQLNGSKQLSLTVSRGCNFNCKYCLATDTFGTKDRRKSVNDVISFIVQHKKDFDSFKFFSPTFNFDNDWVNELCRELIKKKVNISWCATSRIDLLDDERIIKNMAKAGCYKISVGIETINKSAWYLQKKFSKEQIIRVSSYFRKYNIILKGLVMLGVPLQKPEDIVELFELMTENNIKIRPTSYSPMHLLKKRSNITINDIEKFDKITYYDNGINGVSKEDFFKLLLLPENFKNILKKYIKE